MFRGGDLALRVITNRYREKDGGDLAAENLIGWLRNTADCPFPKTLALVYAPRTQYDTFPSHCVSNSSPQLLLQYAAAPPPQVAQHLPQQHRDLRSALRSLRGAARRRGRHRLAVAPPPLIMRPLAPDFPPLMYN